MTNKKSPASLLVPLVHSHGDVLPSQELALQVFSALEVLTVVFGMGTRVSPPPSSPDLSVVGVDVPLALKRGLHINTHTPLVYVRRHFRDKRYIAMSCFHVPWKRAANVFYFLRRTQVKPSTDSYPSAPHVTMLTHRTDLPCLLQGVLLR